MCKRLILLPALCLVFLSVAQIVVAQASLPIYTDNLVNGFQNWSWAANDPNNTSPVHSGGKSISVSANYWEGLSFHQADFDATIYANVIFWAHGGATGGQRLQVFANYGTSGGPAYSLPALASNTWQQFVIPLSALGVADKTDLNRLSFQLTAGGTTGTFYVDDIQITARPAPSLVHINVNAAQAIRAADARWFGVNAAIWDSNFDTGLTIAWLREMGCLALRYPGGSRSDDYHWYNNRSVSDNITWATSPAKFAHVATNLGARVFITVNYGTGTPEEAADWVRSSNVTNHYGYKNWEIGNECYGPWEQDFNVNPHDPYTYAVRAADYIQQMKAADPTIEVGVVVVPGEDSFANGYTAHPAYNPRTGQTHYGWTPVMLTTLKNLGVTPDFVIHHFYPQYTSPVASNSGLAQAADSDPLLLQAAANWAKDAADLRQQITDYLGNAGTNVELVCTENNSDAGGLGKQLTSIVNALYLADSLAQLMKTEFNALMWWDLRNGAGATGSFDPTLYGWRTVGDEGMIGSAAIRYPVFYAEKLMQYFVRPGDTVINATSDYLLLSAYAARKADGGLALLVINKDATTNFNAQIRFSNFYPDPIATVRTYGISQDEASRTNGSVSARDIATNLFSAGVQFTNSFPPYSLTLFTFAPGVRPTTLTVTNTADRGPGTLREALASAFDGDTIDFSLTMPATILLTSGELLVNKSVTILGPGPSNLALNGNHASRVFHIAPSNTVIIAGLTITNGLFSGLPQVSSGGGIYNEQATLTVSNCVLSGNSAITGGGIKNFADVGSASLRIVNSSLANNTATRGGGIDNVAGGYGSVTVEIDSCTLNGNRAFGFGGGIFNGLNGNTSVLIVNSTLSGNSATYGGGIFSGDGSFASLRIFNCTLSGNSDTCCGGGIINYDNALMEIGGTILNAGTSGGNIENVYSGRVISDGYNLSSDDGYGVLTNATDQINTDPRLGPLQNNGGPTLTHAPLLCSPAIDQGYNFSSLATDQRGDGYARTFDDPAVPNATGGDSTDIGAFEVEEHLVDTTPPEITCPDNVATDATSPVGVVVSFSDPAASDNCSVASVSCSPASGSTFTIGTTTVTCRAIDTSANTNTCTFTVHIEGAAEQIDDLIALVRGLGLESGTANSLTVKLQGAASALDKGNTQAVCGSLGAFLNEVNAQADKKITAAQADLLIEEATRIRTVLGC